MKGKVIQIIRTFPHGNKLYRRSEGHPEEKPLLQQLKSAYIIWKNSCLKVTITNENDLKQIIQYTNNYIDFWHQEIFDKIRNNGQSQLYPSVLEETMYYLFNTIVKPPLVCGTRTICISSYIKPYNELNFNAFYEDNLCFETMDADFVIGMLIDSMITKKKEIIPFVIIENKKYADKTMRGRGEDIKLKLKRFSTDCLYAFVVDILRGGSISKDFNPNLCTIDQIYGVREWNDDSKNELKENVVFTLFSDVVYHLHKIKKESISMEERFNRGFMMDRYTPPLPEVFQIVEEFQKIKPITEQPIIMFNKENIT
jgi:hypothetical protein